MRFCDAAGPLASNELVEIPRAADGGDVLGKAWTTEDARRSRKVIGLSLIFVGRDVEGLVGVESLRENGRAEKNERKQEGPLASFVDSTERRRTRFEAGSITQWGIGCELKS